MNPTLKNVLIFIAALAAGMAANMLLVKVGEMIIPFPEGYDYSSGESIKNTIHLLEPKHMIFAYLAHMAQALVGGFIVAKFAASNHFKLAMGIGALALLGGLAMILMVKGPMWFNILDLVSYIPFAYLGYKLGFTETA